MLDRRSFLAAGSASVALASLGLPAAALAATGLKLSDPTPFSFERLIAQARTLATRPYVVDTALPAAVLERFQGNSAIAFAIIPSIAELGDLAPAVRGAFAGAIRVIFIVAIPLSALAFVLSLFAKAYTLATAIEDTTFGMEERSRPASAQASV